MSLKDHLGLSSLTVISVLTSLCDELGVDILKLTDADLARLDTVGDLMNLFAKHSQKVPA